MGEMLKNPTFAYFDSFSFDSAHTSLKSALEA